MATPPDPLVWSRPEADLNEIRRTGIPKRIQAIALPRHLFNAALLAATIRDTEETKRCVNPATC